MVNVAFIGTGINRIHMKWVNQNPDASIMAIASTHSGQLKELSDLYHATPYDDHREMLDEEDVD